MSNFLRVARVQVQEIDEAGNPIGEPEFGVLAMDNYEQGFHLGFQDVETLNEAIEAEGNILDMVSGFELVDRSRIGTRNFEGSVSDPLPDAMLPREKPAE
jgi:hypothetical protein